MIGQRRVCPSCGRPYDVEVKNTEDVTRCPRCSRLSSDIPRTGSPFDRCPGWKEALLTIILSMVAMGAIIAIVEAIP